MRVPRLRAWPTRWSALHSFSVRVRSKRRGTVPLMRVHQDIPGQPPAEQSAPYEWDGYLILGVCRHLVKATAAPLRRHWGPVGNANSRLRSHGERPSLLGKVTHHRFPAHHHQQMVRNPHRVAPPPAGKHRRVRVILSPPSSPAIGLACTGLVASFAL